MRKKRGGNKQVQKGKEVHVTLTKAMQTNVNVHRRFSQTYVECKRT